MKKDINLKTIEQAVKLERKLEQIAFLEPSEEWWERFAEYQQKNETFRQRKRYGRVNTRH